MIQLLNYCTVEGTNVRFFISNVFIKIDSSNSFDMTMAYNENLTTILWDSGMFTIARHCNWCEIFNAIFSDTDIRSSFPFKMTDQFDGMRFLWISRCYIFWAAFCDIICFFCQQWSNFVSGFKMIVFWPSLSFTASFRTANDMPNRNFLGSSHFLFGFIFDGSICPISFVITSWARMFFFKVVLSFLSFFISSPRNLIFCFFEVIFISEACKKFWVWSNWLNNGINIMQNLTSSL